MIKYLNKRFVRIKLIIKWRKYNKHNQTRPVNNFPFNLVKVGIGSYGDLHVRSFGANNENLLIGNFVSIARNVIFILGGNHKVNTLTSFPLYSKYILNSPFHDAQSKGPIIVNDEVWIGEEALILSGVTIGQGAIVGAGSVVTKNIPPYAIVGGSPAKILKYRFTEEIRNALEGLNLTDFNENTIIENIEEFYKELDLQQIESLKMLSRIR